MYIFLSRWINSTTNENMSVTVYGMKGSQRGEAIADNVRVGEIGHHHEDSCNTKFNFCLIIRQEQAYVT